VILSRDSSSLPADRSAMVSGAARQRQC